MEFIKDLLWGSDTLWGGGVAHSVLVLALVIAFGVMFGKVKIAGISLGVTCVLFVGIVLGHFGININEHLLHFMKEFGLILFVYSIGLQVGPGFFASFRAGGVKLNQLAIIIVSLGALTTIALHYITGLPITTMVGIMSGAVTNTPGLGAAQQAYADSGMADPEIADSISLGYAVAYPLGVIGIIFTMIIMRYILRVDFKKEDEGLAAMSNETHLPHRYSVEFTNEMLAGKTIAIAHMLINRQFVVSRIMHASGEIVMADGNSQLALGDRLRIICTEEDRDAILAFFGKPVEMTADEWGATAMQSTPLVSRRILITRDEINGKKFADLRLRTRYGINITRVHRAGVDLIPYQGMELQVGDKVMVVGPEAAVQQAENVLGNSLKKLDHPNLLPVFIGIALGVLLGSLPLMNVPQPVKLGLAGGPLIVAILLGRFGPHFGLVTYTTMSANLMLREIGLAMFLAAVGIGAGDGFVDAIIGGGYKWVGYGVIITVLPLVIVALIARLKGKLNYYTMMGLMAGAMTDPPALGFASTSSGNDMPAVSYATVYPVVMFLRVLTAQLLMLMAV